MLVSILGSHPHIHAIDHETTAFHPSHRPEKLFSALFFENESRRRQRIPVGKTRFAEKTPGNVHHASEIDRFFRGRVKMVNIFRDGRDVITSRHPQRPGEYWVPLSRWIRDVESGLRARAMTNVLSVRFEDLVTGPEEAIRRLCDFLEEPYDARMLEFHKHTNVREHLAWGGNARAIDAGSLRKWEQPEHASRLEEFMSNPKATELSRELGYL